MIDVLSKIKVYEINGTEMKGLKTDRPCLKVLSHWNRSEFITIQLNDEEKITVLAKELIAAIENAKNTARF